MLHVADMIGVSHHPSRIFGRYYQVKMRQIETAELKISLHQFFEAVFARGQFYQLALMRRLVVDVPLQATEQIFRTSDCERNGRWSYDGNLQITSSRQQSIKYVVPRDFPGLVEGPPGAPHVSRNIPVDPQPVDACSKLIWLGLTDKTRVRVSYKFEGPS